MSQRVNLWIISSLKDFHLDAWSLQGSLCFIGAKSSQGPQLDSVSSSPLAYGSPRSMGVSPAGDVDGVCRFQKFAVPSLRYPVGDCYDDLGCTCGGVMWGARAFALRRTSSGLVGQRSGLLTYEGWYKTWRHSWTPVEPPSQCWSINCFCRQAWWCLSQGERAPPPPQPPPTAPSL